MIVAIRERPVLATFVLGVVAAALQIWWVARYRHVGGFGVDESTYLADSLRYHRTLSNTGVGGLIREALGTSRNAPLVPVTSAVLMVIGGRSTTTAIAVQAALYVVTAVAVAGIARRLASDAAALVAGLVALGLPASIVGARSYSFVLAVSASMALAVWSLLASRRGEDRWRMFLFGCAAGAMIISRTMAIAFLPGLAVGALVLVRHHRRSLAGAACAVGGLVLVGAPWWVAQFADTRAYLVTFGYGSGTSQIESIPPLLRLPIRMGLAMTEVRPLLVLPALVVVVCGVVSFLRWRRTSGSVRGWTRHDRELAATGSVLVVGLFALLSSSNMGSGFQVPLLVIAIAPVCAVGARAWGPVVRGALVAAMVAVVLNLALISIWRPGSAIAVGGASASVALWGGTEDGQSIDFAVIDDRFASSSGWATRRQAERDWAALATNIAAEVEALQPGEADVLVSLFGESRLMRAPTMSLTAELEDRTRLRFDQPARPEAMAPAAQIFDPPTNESRVLVFIRSPHYLVDEPVDPLDWVDQAEARGWTIQRSLPMPDGGEAVILTHPDDRAGG